MFICVCACVCVRVFMCACATATAKTGVGAVAFGTLEPHEDACGMSQSRTVTYTGAGMCAAMTASFR